VLARNVDLACTLIEKHIRTTVEQAASEVPGLTMDTARSGRKVKAVRGVGAS
jgi:GntR family carbon starvation induced transcriptional regulator